jgi:hypothetical protein
VTASRIEDLTDVSVEHMLGMATGLPLVKFRAESNGTVLLGQLDPDAARQIAGHLLESTARAEYEADFANATQGAGFSDDLVAELLGLVRQGEIDRHAGGAS